MSVKEQIVEAVADLPDDVSLEEAIERIYQIIKINRGLQAGGRGSGRRRDVFEFVRGLAPGDRSKEDIDRQIREERDDWEER